MHDAAAWSCPRRRCMGATRAALILRASGHWPCLASVQDAALLVKDILTVDAWGLLEPHSSCARQAYLNREDV
jgi:hypothetical protein